MKKNELEDRGEELDDIFATTTSVGGDSSEREPIVVLSSNILATSYCM